MRSKKILLAIFIGLFISNIFYNNTVYANNVRYVYKAGYNHDFNIEYEETEMSFIGSFTEEEEALFLFDIFFVMCDNELVHLSMENGCLELYVTSQIRNYGGGTAREIILVQGILKNAFQFDEVDNVTLYIGGQIDYLPEGSMLNKFERKDFICE